MKAVEIVDISKSGISFKMDPKGSFYNVGEDVDLRLYFSAKTYLAIKVNVKRVQQNDEDSRPHNLYGCTFDKNLKSYEVVDKLVDFIAAYSEQAKKEDGTEKIFHF
jgi:hypothetical protein